ncbi:DUF2243 domain-containing protein [Comamonas endophytica]|uniref:DUF2243 domain-containing protein n=1 Tax=Comamonas endophytica TaxID=2949090 RepID=A0ABY6GFA5_9BURK|nr:MULTISPECIES: DUF2243 domain-containing protein [unclassified Acidovorax]MCD2514467.1 DUF2243 domain-containing protein [Acidovorax sp. D4N7]UYG53756.1 DUF2243 domain-containing protein [Acidovorax sp. 5MLIR]
MTHRRPLLAAGILMGAGMGGFVDGIVFHQILQWHNMLSGVLPPTNLVDAKINMVWDGLFHAAVWLMTFAGLWMLVRASGRSSMPWSPRLFWGAWFMGWGLFNFLEGGINHLILGIHHVNEYAPNPLAYDLVFQASGVALVLLGWLVRPSPTAAEAGRRG